jgi:hypothetical protein
VVWICATFNIKGKRHCASKQIPEETLKAVSADILGTVAFDDGAFAERVSHITALPNNMLEYHLSGGSTKIMQWTDRSRRESWTNEMRQAAREKMLRRNGTCYEQ